jgi:hypothetical protein
MSSDSAPSSSTGEGTREEQPDAALCHEAEPVQSDASSRFGRCNVLLLSFLSLFLIGFGVWVVSAGGRYREEYAQATQGWRVGSIRSVDLTVVKDDRHNLACASDQVIEGLHCGFRSDLREAGPASSDNSQILQPLNTVGNELLLGAGLWNSSDFKNALPQARFTVICNYTIKGVMKSALIRFDPAASFNPVGKTVTVGTLTDCMIPR